MTSLLRNLRKLDNTPLPVVHPAVQHYGWTVGSATDKSLVAGVAPPVLVNILMGRMKSNEAVDSLLEKYHILTAEEIAALRDDYNPLRFFTIIPSLEKKHYIIKDDYTASSIEPGDAVRVSTDEGSCWVLVEEVIREGDRITLISGGASIASVSEKAFVITAVSVHSRGNYTPVDEGRKTKSNSKRNLARNQSVFRSLSQDNKAREQNERLFDSLLDDMEDAL